MIQSVKNEEKTGQISSRAKKISLIDDNLSMELFNSARQRKSLDSLALNLHSKDILIFSSENENLINTWLTVLNYFVRK
jgi:hypothetical protein